MPARVHALLVVRPDGRKTAAAHLQRTLAALAAQTRRADALTIVLSNPDRALTELAAASGAEGVITAGAIGYAQALRLAAPRLRGDAVWLLAQDTAPAPDALARLVGALELAPSVGVVGPKLVDWDLPDQIESLGRTVELADGELDQGQHDGDSDVLGVDVRGVLVRTELWRRLDGLDAGLAGADEGLDLGIRARLAGALVHVVPGARVAVAGDGAAGLPDPSTRRRRRRRAYAERVAQLHRRLVYAPAVWVFPHWLTILPLALWRTVLLLIAKQPSRVLPEWGAAFTVLVRLGSIARARGRIRANRASSWHQLAGLRVSRTAMRERLDADGDIDAASKPVREELRFFTGGGAWLALGALVVSAVLFPALLAWSTIGGGALAPMRTTVAQLWADAASGLRATGLDSVGVADPFSAIVAILGTLTPFEPSRAIVLLWLLAFPLAVLGGWFAATRVTNRSFLQAVGGVVWGLAPTFWIALMDGRPQGVIVHLLLPWLFYAGSVAHRSWSAAGVASILAAAVAATSPSLAPLLVVVWALGVMATLIFRAGRGVGHIVWSIVPTVVIAAPLVWEQLRLGNPWGLLADPGPVWAGPVAAADAAGRAALIAGFPVGDLGGWTDLLAGTTIPGWAVFVLIAPLGLCALLALLSPRWMVGAAGIALSALGLVTALVVVGIQVSATATGESVAIWPGTALSIGWLGALVGALVFLDAGVHRRVSGVRTAGGIVLIAATLVAVLPAATAMLRGDAALSTGNASTLPAYVAAQGNDDPSVGTLVLTSLPDGSVASRVVWGGSETLGGQSTVQATAPMLTAEQTEVAELTAGLVAGSAQDVVADVAARGISFIVVTAAAADESALARQTRLTAINALNQRDALESAGTTPKGNLWRIDGEIGERSGAGDQAAHTATIIALGQLLVVAIAVLLAVPTSSSRRQARRTSRIVGPRAAESEL